MTSVAEIRPSLRERKKRQTRAAIIEAAVQYAEAQGYEQTSIDTISDAAEVSRGTFFNYFGYKEAVIVEWGHDRLTALDIQVTDAIAAGIAADLILSRLWLALRKIATEHRAAVAVLVAELFNADSARAAFAANSFALAAVVERIIVYGQATGQFRADLDASQAGQLFANAIMASMALPAHANAGAEAFARQGLAVLLHGALDSDSEAPIANTSQRERRTGTGNAAR